MVHLFLKTGFRQKKSVVIINLDESIHDIGLVGWNRKSVCYMPFCLRYLSRLGVSVGQQFAAAHIAGVSILETLTGAINGLPKTSNKKATDFATLD